jgi:hypothetical protein
MPFHTSQTLYQMELQNFIWMEDTDILYTNNHVVTYVPDPNQTFRL